MFQLPAVFQIVSVLKRKCFFFFYIVVKMYLYDLKKVELEIDGVIFLL